MQNNIYYRYIYMMFVLIVTGFAAIGCIRNDGSQCASTLLKFKAVINVNGAYQEVGEDHVKEVALHVYGENEEFLETHNAKIGSTVSLYYPNHRKLNLVCWGNSASEQQVTPALKLGDNLEGSLITVITEDTRATEEKTTTHPDDLFHGTREIVIEDYKASVIEMVISHKVASVNITARGLMFLNRADEDYSYVLRSGKKHVNFRGQTLGNDVHHTQKALLENGLHESGIFNILPSTDIDNNIEVDIYKGTEFIYTIVKNNNGDQIIAKEGELLNIYADFGDGSGDVSINIAITPWGEKKIWKEMQ